MAEASDAASKASSASKAAADKPRKGTEGVFSINDLGTFYEGLLHRLLLPFVLWYLSEAVEGLHVA
jgi:hypothetical protein